MPEGLLFVAIEILARDFFLSRQDLSFAYQWYHKLSLSCVVNYFNPVSSIYSYNTRQSQVAGADPGFF